MMATLATDAANDTFNSILTNLKHKFQIIASKWIDNKVYEIKFRTSIAIGQDDYNKYCDEWVREFSCATDTVWVHKISNTGPKVKFRKLYQCWPYPNKCVDKKLLFDPQRCRATLDIKVLDSCLSSRGKTNRFKKLGLNIIIKLCFQHLHLVDSTKEFSCFVHNCKPSLTAPATLPALPAIKVHQLMEKVIESAAVTSQRAAERAKEALRKCCAGPGCNNSNVSSQEVVVPTAASNHLHPQGNVLYVQQVVFDSATQTLKEVALTANSISRSTQVIAVQVPSQTVSGAHFVRQF